MGSFAVVLGERYRHAAPGHDMEPQISRLGGYFIVVTTYFLSKRLPNGCLMCMWRGTHFCNVHSFLPVSEIPIAMTSGKVQSSFLHHCYFSPNSLLRRLKTVLELIALRLNVK